MRLFSLFQCLPLLLLSLNSATHGVLNCLPQGVNSDEVVNTEAARNGMAQRVTVAERLAQLKARCKRGKLVDRRGRQIYFYRLEGCWGNPPANYQEILKQQEQELSRLKKRYTVIEMTCNPSGAQIP